MKPSLSKFIVLASADGPEAEVSTSSGKDASLVLDAPLLFLEQCNWQVKLEHLNRDWVAFLATHGGFGEDGRLQVYLEKRGIPHSHSCAHSASIMCNKHQMKLFYQSQNIPTPNWFYKGIQFGGTDSPSEVGLVSKPIDGGSKIGVTIVAKMRSDSQTIYEEIVSGNLEISVWVVGERNRKVVTLPPLLRERSLRRIGDLHRSHAIVPAYLYQKCLVWGKRIHEKLPARGITKTDFLIDAAYRPYAIETDAHPAISSTSSAAMQAKLVGISYQNLIKKIGEGSV